MIERRMKSVEIEVREGMTLAQMLERVASEGGDPATAEFTKDYGWEEEEFTYITFERLETWEEAAEREAKEAAREEVRAQRVAMGLPPDPGHFIGSTPPVDAGPGDVWIQI